MNFFVPLRQNMNIKAEKTARKWRLPAEWEPQWGVQLTWPHAHTDWAPILNDIIETYHQMAREIAKRERLIVIEGGSGQWTADSYDYQQDGIALKQSHHNCPLSTVIPSSVPLTTPGRAIMALSPSPTTRGTTVCSTTVSTAGERNSLLTTTMPSTERCLTQAS